MLKAVTCYTTSQACQHAHTHTCLCCVSVTLKPRDWATVTVTLSYGQPPPHVWGSLKFCHFLVRTHLVFFPISVSAGFSSFPFWHSLVDTGFGCFLCLFSPVPLSLLSHSLGWEVQWERGVRQETADPLQQRRTPPPWLQSYSPLSLLYSPNPSHSVEIITFRLNSEGFRFSLLSFSPWLLLSVFLSSHVWKTSKCCSLWHAWPQVCVHVF